MKKIMNNNHGYALVTVLLIITVFMLLSFSFMGQSANTIKQNQVVEKNSQSVALAEMGIMYFEHLTRNEYDSNRQKVIDVVKAQRDSDIKNNIFKTDDHYKQLAISNMEDILKSQLSEETKQIDHKPTASFTIKNDSGDIVSRTTNGLKIEFSSIGRERSNETTITGALVIDFTNWMSRAENPGNGSGSNESEGKLLTGNEILDPGTLTGCDTENKKDNFTGITCQINDNAGFDNNDQLTFENSIFKVNGSLTNTGNLNKDIINSTLYIKGDMNTGNMNSLVKLRMHVQGNGIFGHFNGNGLYDSLIEIGGDAKMDNMKLEKSKMYIGGTANIGQINDIKDSIIYINSSADIQGINFGSNSTVCVNGPLTIGNINENITSKIYAKSSNNSKVITDQSAFNNACKGGGNQSPISWGDSSISAEYDYKY